jgi:hypothetical protein
LTGRTSGGSSMGKGGESKGESKGGEDGRQHEGNSLASWANINRAPAPAPSSVRRPSPSVQSRSTARVKSSVSQSVKASSALTTSASSIPSWSSRQPQSADLLQMEDQVGDLELQWAKASALLSQANSKWDSAREQTQALV